MALEMGNWGYNPTYIGGYNSIFTLPETKSHCTWKPWWLEDDPFLLGFGLFSGANC